ncbi:MAG: glycosyltransferase family 2 protein [Candidatus Omnitrophica bacterium]|nr:glycosyltransferase family 2 protein [Candidatus Omnitrophota bacterium]
MSADDSYLSIVIPAYNAERYLEETVRRLEAFMSLKQWNGELLVVSDGSTDKTDALAARLAGERPGGRLRFLASPVNRGKGCSVRKGVLEARGQIVLVTDVGLSAPIKEADKLIAALESGCDIAIGSLALRKEGCDVQQGWKRRLAGRVFNFLVRLFVLRDFRDTQCGFKCFKREAAQELFRLQKLDGFAFDVEVLYLAKKKGFKVKEVPVMWREARESRVKLLKDSLAMIRELFLIRRHHPDRQ